MTLVGLLVGGGGGWIIKTYNMLPLLVEEMLTSNCEKKLEFKRQLIYEC